jgi:hypothetical protein
MFEEFCGVKTPKAMIIVPAAYSIVIAVSCEL